MTAIKISRPSSSLSATKNQKNSNKNRFSLLDFTVLGSASSVKIVSNPVDLEPLDLDDLIEDDAEGWSVPKNGKSKEKLSTIHEEPEGMLQFSASDVKKELDFWQNFAVCFILGANPPWEVVEDFIYRSWDEYGVDRVSFLPSGVFLVRFRKKKDLDSVVHHGHFLFDNKPIIVRPWSPSVSLKKEQATVVPVWVRFLDLPLKFWGNCIPRISGLIGDFVRCDGPLEERTRLAYARVLVDVPFGKALPSTVKFLNEHGEEVTIKVESEWSPILCKDCGGRGGGG
ncbi:uncharacterized protein LOC141595288 [Silene latifolia]|uniref:uncharacterized protein LOC141595288 n=1 Tax=Silene latifolia TaxID=37657 RepID=UPI003D779900